MGSTTTWDITYPDATTNLTPLESHFETLAETADQALTDLQSDIITTNINPINARLQFDLKTGTSAPSGTATEGSFYWDSTLNILYIYSTSNWVRVWGQQTSAWVTIAASGSGVVAATGGNTPSYKIVGQTVFLRGAFSSIVSGTPVAGTFYSVATLPEQARPDLEIRHVSAFEGSTNFCTIRVATTGVVSIAVNAATTGSAYIAGSYPLA
jgi:hypothetical protein